MSGRGRIDNLGPPEYPLLSIYRVHPFCLCDSVTCLTSPVKNFSSLAPLGWFPKILARCAPCGETLYPIAPPGETALVRQFQFSALRRLETTHPRPAMTGPAKSEDRRGSRWGKK